MARINFSESGTRAGHLASERSVLYGLYDGADIWCISKSAWLQDSIWPSHDPSSAVSSVLRMPCSSVLVLSYNMVSLISSVDVVSNRSLGPALATPKQPSWVGGTSQ